MRILFLITIVFAGLLCTASTIDHDGIKRRYFLHIPKTYNNTENVPLLVVLHGGGGHAKRMKRFMQFDELAEKENFIVLYPQGYRRQWNDGRNSETIPAHVLDIDDVSFISRLIDTVCSQYRIDEDRIYVTGLSNGGFMSTRLGCELSNRIAAIAPMISTFPEALYKKCTPPGPVPVMIINGTEDPLVPYNGGEVIVGKKSRGKVLSTDETVKFWVSHNKCSPTAHVKKMENTDDDNISSVQEVYVNKKRIPLVVLIKVLGGGHTVPGGKQYLPEFVIGKVCDDFIAEEYIWEFFKIHSK